MKFLEKIRSLPEKTRKIILWLVLIVLALIMFSWWASRIPGKIGQISFPEIDIPKIDMPKIEIPNASSTQEN